MFSTFIPGMEWLRGPQFRNGAYGNVKDADAVLSRAGRTALQQSRRGQSRRDRLIAVCQCHNQGAADPRNGVRRAAPHGPF
jgi:hypothetical protein